MSGVLRAYGDAEMADIERRIVERLELDGPLSYAQLLLDVRGYDRIMACALQNLLDSSRIWCDADGRYTIGAAGSTFYTVPCEGCDGTTIALTPSGEGLLSRLQDLARERPAADTHFKQRHVDLPTALRRALFARRRGDVVGRRIVCLGDDDLTSLALALVGGATEIGVLDIDERVLDFLDRRLSNVGGCRFRLLRYDCSRALQASWMESADCVFIDPSTGLLQIFLRRALELLRDDRRTTIYVSSYSQAKEPTIDLQRFATRWNLLMTDVVPSFNRYLSLPELLPPSQRARCESPSTPETWAFVESFIRLLKIGSRPWRRSSRWRPQ